MEILRPASVYALVQGPVLAAMLALIAIEALLLILVFRRRYDAGETAASLGVALGNIAVRPLNRLIITAGLSAVAVFAPWQLPIDSVWTWLFGFVGVEFCYYWMHRFAHTVRWMWTTHSVHHSSGRFTLATALRLGWTSGLSGEWLVFAPLVLIGFPPVVIAVLLALNLLYQFFLHTELSPRWSVVDYILNTPAHQVSAQAEECVNYGMPPEHKYCSSSGN
ncbi:sterol desaturase family protein [Asticcacaulis sp. AC402]|uniref:sterol desaturase family protein n=1 Tax=Asticcacaulis sp. AC402 TaxID=1282361 RepID=UPI0003C3CC99|nr:sterol desaturase family protein [Asticcacaulis sp. AC402]ESQ73990.1 hypothetical protein ABAC402_16625 [Asticcacaulis sp. AC402]